MEISQRLTQADRAGKQFQRAGQSAFTSAGRRAARIAEGEAMRIVLLAILLCGCAAKKPATPPPPATQPVNDCNSCIVVEQN